jgi:hypothetical protein
MKKGEEILHRISKIEITLAEQHVTLKEHIRRTELLESKVVPLEKSSFKLDTVYKFLFHSGIVAGVVEGLHRIFR